MRKRIPAAIFLAWALTYLILEKVLGPTPFSIEMVVSILAGIVAGLLYLIVMRLTGHRQPNKKN